MNWGIYDKYKGCLPKNLPNLQEFFKCKTINLFISKLLLEKEKKKKLNVAK